ncbi:hypothetical protein H072_5809 [Dactylellina haptotyla CBS 200.50]|uniref:Uncharacterized protein n=1 Tax=Dactylellina haptotyla (strain CBS 200.50) TaxID=1284197 RepID=S8ABQ4_DACHA|nr:hypothetical protein H072_5809 [Dactylellina haptotyla CBS 200.50]
MKSAVVLTLFAALAAAAPQTLTGPGRCGGDSGLKCHKNALCVGEKEIKGGVGICITGPIQPCGNFFGDRCPSTGSWYCISDPRINCPPGVMDCGGGVCMPAQWAAAVGLN